MSSFFPTAVPLTEACRSLKVSYKSLGRMLTDGKIDENIAWRIGGKWYVDLDGLRDNLNLRCSINQDGAHNEHNTNREYRYAS